MQQKNTVKSLKYSKGIMFQAKIIGFLGLSPILRQPNGPVVFDSYAFHHSLHKLLKSSSCVSSSAKHNDGSLKEVAVRSIWRFPKSWGYPNSWIVYNGKSFNKMDDFVVAPFLETSNFALEASVFFLIKLVFKRSQCLYFDVFRYWGPLRIAWSLISDIKSGNYLCRSRMNLAYILRYWTNAVLSS